jgi:L-malate glycosyltransferase
MKIAILTSSFPYYKGDFHGSFIYEQALGQVMGGHEVHVICPHVPGLKKYEIMEGIVVHRFPYFLPESLEKLSSDTGMYSALRHSLLAWFQLPFYLLCQWYWTVRIIRHHSIEIIHSHWIVPQGLPAYICRKIYRIPHVISSHVADAQVFSTRRVPVIILKLILSGTDFLTTNSSYTKRVIMDLVPVPCPCRVIPMGVNIPVCIPNTTTATDAPRILFVGRLIAWKGVDTLIRAMVPVLENKSGAILSIVGEGPTRGHLEQLARDLGISKNIQFLGRVDETSLDNLYALASVLVLPSRQYKGMVMEGLGVVLLEAMARGVPVIGSDIGGIPDIISNGENGYLFSPDNSTDLAQKILLISGDSMLIEQFRNRGLETVQMRFSWKEISQQFTDIYQQLIEHQSRGGLL